MRRWTLPVLFIVLAASLLISPYFFGVLIEKHFKETMAKSSTPRTTYTISDYNRGWFNSTATLTISITNRENPATITITNKIAHGPFAYNDNVNHWLPIEPALGVIHSKVHLTSLEQIKALPVKVPVLDATTILGFTGSFGTAFSSNKFVSQDKQNESGYSINRLLGELEIDHALENVFFQLNGLGVHYHSKGKRLDSSDALLSFNRVFSSKNNWKDTFIFDLPFVTLTEADNKLFQLSGLAITNENHNRNDLLDTTFKMGFENLVIAARKYGPGLIVLAFRNLDGSALEAIQTQLQQIRQQGAVTQNRQTLLKTFMPLWSTLVAKGATVELKKFILPTHMGKFDMSGRLGFAKTQTANNSTMPPLQHANLRVQFPKAMLMQMLSQHFYRMFTMQQMLKQIELSQKKPAADKAKKPALLSPQQITAQAKTVAKRYFDTWIKSGLLIESGATCKIQVAYTSEQKQWTINDVPFSQVQLQIQQQLMQ